MKACPKCGGSMFSAHQRIYVDVVVNGDNVFERNLSEGKLDTTIGVPSADIYEAETPYGPYTCLNCGTEHDDICLLPEIN